MQIDEELNHEAIELVNQEVISEHNIAMVDEEKPI
jgi:hypothetical protein